MEKIGFMGKISLYKQVSVAIGLGIFIGILIGPLTTFFKPIADIYTGLVQMAFLPLLGFSIIYGFGSLDRKRAWTILKKFLLFFFLLWGMVFLATYCINVLVPEPQETIVNHEVDPALFGEKFLSYILPQNPFYDFRNNVVPAVTFFGLVLGMAIMALPQKEPLMHVLDSSCYALEKILFWLARVSPIGIFAIIAYEAGTLDFHELWKMRFLLFSAVGLVLFFFFLFFPLLLCTITPLSYRSVLKEFSRVGLISFAVGSSGIALPFIVRALRKFAKKNKVVEGQYPLMARATIPTGFGFGQIGNAFAMVFLLFFAFYFRNPLLVEDRIFLYLAMVPFSLGSSTISKEAIFYLFEKLGFIDQANIIYSELIPVIQHFQVLLSVIAVLSFSYLVVSFYFQLQKKRILYFLGKLAFSFGCIIIFFFLIRGEIKMHDYYKNLFVRLRIQDVVEDPVRSVVIKPREDWYAFKGENQTKKGIRPLQKVLESGVLRVGYDPRMIPFCYWNHKEELVGYDVAFAYQLARDLDCLLEFRPVVLEDLDLQLDLGYYDIAMSGLIMDENRLPFMLFSDPYEEQNNVLIVPYQKRAEYSNLKKVQENSSLTIGVIGEYYEISKRHFPKSKIVRIHHLEEINKIDVDVVMAPYYEGFIWSLQHPNYVVIDYDDLIGKQYFAYPIYIDAFSWKSFVNNWLHLKEQSGFTKRQRNYWMEGKKPKSPEERWSLLRDILHWIE